MIFVIASNNKKKVEELSRILRPLGIQAKTPSELGITLEDVEETGTTFQENAEIKAEAASRKTGLPALADDSGLMVDALDGRPGVFSARYAENDQAKIEKLLRELNESGTTDRTAHFVCCICCYFPGGEKLFASGQCDGTIGFAPRGSNGFGYDPVFFVDGNKTFAEISEKQKDAMSHRGKALKQLSIALTNRFEN